jgi:hypothetical protein
MLIQARFFVFFPNRHLFCILFFFQLLVLSPALLQLACPLLALILCLDRGPALHAQKLLLQFILQLLSGNLSIDLTGTSLLAFDYNTRG